MRASAASSSGPTMRRAARPWPPSGQRRPPGARVLLFFLVGGVSPETRVLNDNVYPEAWQTVRFAVERCMSGELGFSHY
ncbi:hypothetical protein AB1Y20_023493 [Prymnesium parvum]|uniref:Uncharacterized protein n=1 Tax=Prymnesium parvum TaxID=97485 RepID=A0AB34JGE4_PRYPA